MTILEYFKGQPLPVSDPHRVHNQKDISAGQQASIDEAVRARVDEKMLDVFDLMIEEEAENIKAEEEEEEEEGEE